MVVGRRQKFGFFVGYPLVAFGATTIGTMAISARMKLVLFVSAVGTFAPIMMHANVARVAVGQFLKDVPAVLIVYCSTGFTKYHLLEFLAYLSHFSGGLGVRLKLTFEW